ncbi:MAG TPA: DNA-binding response regulator [Myxococcales bacterium]|nr:DNA-binding response regulator [Deltaproteobacteria bacterium]MBU47869.1 DNA-binding response regulator [Deltaproteobacteria bacterium]HAA53653.1 DNA-binding response regulator [Myxococcales bacterium]|tara:strand:- start:772 stop:1461 length:690 start_codon:yes stop_codon:yes gene_type:complete
MDNKPHILIIEDDLAIATNLVKGLHQHNFHTTLEMDGEAGLERALQEEFDLLLLDLMLPGINGIEILTQLKTRTSLPVIVLTARTDLEARLEVFEQGAIDYVAKPFWIEEIIARIEARLRLVKEKPNRKIAWSNVIIDLDARTATKDESLCKLTQHEFNVLSYLLERPERALSRSQIADGALSLHSETAERTVDSHIARIRKKLGKDASKHIKTVWGIGYQFLPTIPES